MPLPAEILESTRPDVPQRIDVTRGNSIALPLVIGDDGDAFTLAGVTAVTAKIIGLDGTTVVLDMPSTVTDSANREITMTATAAATAALVLPGPPPAGQMSGQIGTWYCRVTDGTAVKTIAHGDAWLHYDEAPA